MNVIPVLVILMFFSLPIVSSSNSQITLSQNGSYIELHQIVGQEQSKNVYLENDQLSIIYSSSLKVDSILLVINGSSYDNQTVSMTYLKFQDNNYLYTVDLVLTSYTTFYGYTNTSGIIKTEFFSTNTDIHINSHRIWTTKDRSPVLLDVKYGQLETNSLEPAVSTYSVDNSSTTTVRYLSITKIPSPVTLIYGPQGNSKELVYSILMTQDVNNTNEYIADLPHFSRELWFTAFSGVSYEVNQNNVREFSYHRITNGIKIFDLEYFGRTNNQTSQPNDQNIIYANITTLNETSHETLKLHVRINSTEVSSHFPVMNQTMIINSTFYSVYEVELGKYSTDTSIKIDVEMIDSDSGQIVGYFNGSDLIVNKYGPGLSFENLNKTTSFPSIEVHFIVFDYDKGISYIKMTTNNTTYDLKRSVRSAKITLLPGINLITLNVSNLDHEISVISSTIRYDNSRPDIGRIWVEPASMNYSLQALVYDNSSVDSGLKYYVININNVTTLTNFDTPYHNTTIYKLFKPKIGNNIINLTIYDVAGNYFSKIFMFHYSVSTTQEALFPLVYILVPVIILPILRKYLEW